MLEPRGGLFLIAQPEKLIGKSFRGNVVSISNVPQIFRSEYRLVINSPEWIGIPDYFRFVLSVDEITFNKALAAIQKFTSELK